ncbi:hypothetical protein [Georgenia yuyongxinii]|uniref:hypothetical protein n=1 Tax=Georgenia yuyongxinii TaxID=2589797 RepID=UPI00163DD819|nr:hypothetical protein [Georgenia yuyongxinii]
MSLNPRYLDRLGLTACWREALLVRAMLAQANGHALLTLVRGPVERWERRTATSDG